jgi:hypothetical protein
MMRIRAVVATAAMVVAAAAGSACAGAKPTGKSEISGSIASSTAIASSPPTSGAGTPTSGANGGGNGTNSGSTSKPITPTYAATAKAYATNTVNAYAKGSKTLLDAYTSNGGAVEFANLPKTNMNWHFHRCMPDGTYTQCSYDNDNGDELNVDIDPGKLGEPDAAVNANVQLTEYPSTADAMVNEFLQAWTDGNRYRMVRLSSSSTTSTLISEHGAGGPGGYTLSDNTTDIQGVTIVTVQPLTSGLPFGLTVNNDKLGQPHAINTLAS